MKNKVAKARDVQPWQLHFAVFALTFRVATGFGIGQEEGGDCLFHRVCHRVHSALVRVPCIINIDTLWNAAPRLILV